MIDKFRRREAIVSCDGCDTQRSVFIWAHGAVEPIDAEEICSCAEGRFRIVNAGTQGNSTGDRL